MTTKEELIKVSQERSPAFTCKHCGYGYNHKWEIHDHRKRGICTKQARPVTSIGW